MISNKKFKLSLGMLLFCLVALIILSLSIGDSPFSVLDVLHSILGQASQTTRFIIFSIRLPRILACLIGGASLALSGLLLQTLTRNPLADSGILGINAGAGMVMAVFISYDLTKNLSSLYILPFLAMAGGFVTILLVYGVSQSPGKRMSPVRLIITGVGISTMLSGIMVSVVGTIDQYKVSYIVSWLSGRISGDDWQTLGITIPILILLWLFTASRYQTLNIMTLNEQTSLALGVNLKKERIIILFLATSLASISLLLVGNITFIGLIAGHIARRLGSAKHQHSIPLSLLLGMMLLLISDTMGRVFLVGTDIPTGILVSIFGAPYFLYLMYQEK
ncbi:ABC-type Fe3+-siderophore transport system, permease 2 component [Streptococcus sp. DD10]|uniref:FecCD family ABC transporter permease n=1 Tax=Streptococcus sp. DD10 TaxID=1777878 RepID=UPI0007940219|nr:iron ABC transporter permease [Streptococcus sp. DD10]KXT77178.1 ABC-type Fe3+-siderophore transport system, permease 2 component [Streptococcus sp. DD10]